MNTAVHNKLISFIWSIADDCLRDVYVRGKYRDVILPMVVLRRLDALLEPTKEAVLEELTFQKDVAKFTEWDENGLRQASGYVFYNISTWTLQRLHDTATNNQQILQANVEDYLDGFSKNVKEIIDPRFQIKLGDFWGKEEKADATPRSSDGQLLFLMEMVDKMKPLSQNPLGSRIASVHNGSSLFTGDAGGGESNIRRYIIENDWLDAIVQLPNNLFYNTGITTYIWILSNNKAANRKGKVQLIDAGLLFRKLRKNLGNQNCEFSPEHIREIVSVYTEMKSVERSINHDTKEEEGIASQIFDNADFGYFKVTIERPKRLKAQFTAERIETLRFDRNLREPMTWAFETWGEKVYSDLAKYEKEILDWCEKQEMNLNTNPKAICLTLRMCH